MIRIAILIFL